MALNLTISEVSSSIIYQSESMTQPFDIGSNKITSLFKRNVKVAQNKTNYLPACVRIVFKKLTCF